MINWKEFEKLDEAQKNKYSFNDSAYFKRRKTKTSETIDLSEKLILC